MNIILMGKPGVGKTTLIKEVVEKLDVPTFGFYTEEIRDQERRLGFRIATLEGKEATLAHINILGPHSVGKYGVDVEVLERVAVPAIKEGLVKKGVIIADEIGKMELLSPLFENIIRKALAAESLLVATMGHIDHPLTVEIKKKSRTKLIEVTPSNRVKLLERLFREISESLR